MLLTVKKHPAVSGACVSFLKIVCGGIKCAREGIDEQLGRQILQKALNLTRGEYETFMSGSIEKMIIAHG